MSTDINTIEKIEVNNSIKEPGMFKVIYMNDEVTTQEFVMGSLMGVFEFAVTDAEEITSSIHHDGSAVVAVLPYEIAEEKGLEVTREAKNQNFPLVIRFEPE